LIELADRPEEGAVLDRLTLNRTLLARQLLLDRTDAQPLGAVAHLVGMQSQVPLDPYIGLWSRLQDFDPDTLGQAMLDRRAVRMTLLRVTLHLVTSDHALRFRPALQAALERAFATSAFARELDGLDLAPVLARGAELLGRGPLTTAQLRARLGEEWPGRDGNALAYAVRYLVPLVQITPRGVWGKTLQPTMTTLAAWLEGLPPGSGTTEELVLAYLRAFGPATTADIRTWSWLADVRSTVDGLRGRLRTYRDERGRVLYDVEDGVFADPAAPAPVRFLPQFDNVFLSHADRGRIMREVVWDHSFMHHGAFLADGFLAGRWKLTRTKGEASLAVDIRVEVRAAQRWQIRDEAEALLAFLAPGATARRLELSPS
jgi:Winged helix DNA-binding domain